MKLEFSPTYFRKNTQISISMKIRPVGAELFHADGGTDTTKSVFRNFTHAPKNPALSTIMTHVNVIWDITPISPSGA